MTYSHPNLALSPPHSYIWLLFPFPHLPHNQPVNSSASNTLSQLYSDPPLTQLSLSLSPPHSYMWMLFPFLNLSFQAGDIQGLFDNRTHGATLYGASTVEKSTVVC